MTTPRGDAVIHDELECLYRKKGETLKELRRIESEIQWRRTLLAAKSGQPQNIDQWLRDLKETAGQGGQVRIEDLFPLGDRSAGSWIKPPNELSPSDDVWGRSTWWTQIKRKVKELFTKDPFDQDPFDGGGFA